MAVVRRYDSACWEHFTAYLYGYRNNKYVAVTEGHWSWHSKVDDDFELEDEPEIYRVREGQGDIVAIQVGRNLRIDYCNTDASLGPSYDLYSLLDIIDELGQELGLGEAPYIAAYGYDRVKEWAESVAEKAIDNQDKLNILRGKDLVSLAEEIQNLRQQNKELEGERETLNDDVFCLQELVKQKDEKIIALEKRLMELDNHNKQLLTEREGHKNAILEKVKEVLKGM